MNACQMLECSNQILILNNISDLILQYDASLHKLIHARIGRILDDKSRRILFIDTYC